MGKKFFSDFSATISEENNPQNFLILVKTNETVGLLADTKKIRENKSFFILMILHITQTF